MSNFTLTRFGKFTNAECITLKLRKVELTGKNLILFNMALSKFDFKRLIEQLINTGVHIYYFNSKIVANGYNHIAIVDSQDVHLIKLVADKTKVFESRELLDELI